MDAKIWIAIFCKFRLFECLRRWDRKGTEREARGALVGSGSLARSRRSWREAAAQRFRERWGVERMRVTRVGKIGCNGIVVKAGGDCSD